MASKGWELLLERARTWGRGVHRRVVVLAWLLVLLSVVAWVIELR